MKTLLIPALLAAAFAIGGMSVYAADQAKPAADQPVKAAGAHPGEPGTANDPASAEKKQGTKKGIKTAGAHPGGTAPCSPADAAKGGGKDVKCSPEATAAVPGNQGAPTAADKAKMK